MTWRENLEELVVARLRASDTAQAFRTILSLHGLADVDALLGRAQASAPFAAVKYDDAVAVQEPGGQHEATARLSVVVGGTNYRGEAERRATLYGLLDLVQGALMGWAPAAGMGEMHWVGEEPTVIVEGGVEVWVQEYTVRLMLTA